jgi:hypothetical protein
MTNEPPASDQPDPPAAGSTPSSMPRTTPMSGTPASQPSQPTGTSGPPEPAASPAAAPPPPAAPGSRQSPTPASPEQKRAEDSSHLPFPLQDGENVLAIRRRHWIFLWPTIFGLALAAILPVLLVRWLLDLIGLLDDVEQVFWIIAAIWLLFWGVRLALTYYRYRNDIWVITSQRLIDCRRRHPFDLTVSTADLVNVQDMSVARNGILATMLDYGDINCQTASVDAHDFKLSGIPNPRETQILVDRERDRERVRVRGV